MGTESGSDPESSSNGWSRARGLVVKTLVLIGGALLIKRLTKSTTRRDHARVVSRSLTGEKVFKPTISMLTLLVSSTQNYEILIFFYELRSLFTLGFEVYEGASVKRS